MIGLYSISLTELKNQELKKSLIEALNNKNLYFDDDLVYMDDGLR